MNTTSPCILTINGGSSSIRFALYQVDEALRDGHSFQNQLRAKREIRNG